MDYRDFLETKYSELLRNYLNEQTETALYQGQKFSRKLLNIKYRLKKSLVHTGKFFKSFFLIFSKRFYLL